MSIPSADAVPARASQALDPLPLQGAGLKPGAVYAIGIETAAARLPLLLAPLRAALRAGRPCVLITRLNPEQAPFAELLGDARSWLDAAGLGGADRLQVFTAVGDYDVNLLLHGAERYLQELDQFEIAPGSLLLIDEADDLYTNHDHGALVQQAKAYQAWCARHQHTMLQLHLRTSAHRPLMEGNQAAAHYLAGVGRVTSQPGGMQMAIDFWESPGETRIGIVVALEPWLSSLESNHAMKGAGLDSNAVAAPQLAAATATLPRLWWVGAWDADLHEWQRHFVVRVAPTLAEVLAWPSGAQTDRLSIVVTLGSPDRFDELIAQLAQLRRTVGQRARIVIRESRYRLREYTQKRRLLRAGVDAVLAPAHSWHELATLLLQPRVGPAAEVADGVGHVAPPWALESQNGDATGWVSSSTFVDEVQRRVWRDRLSAMPHAMVEVEFEDLCASESAVVVKSALKSGRTGDLSTAARGARFFFLRGCRGSDSVPAVTRCMGDALAQRVQRIHVYAGELAIGERLLRLRREAGAAYLSAGAAQGKSAARVALPPAASRADASPIPVGTVSAAALLIALTWPLADARAQAGAQMPEQASAAAVAIASLAYERGDYIEAARRGLIELQREPDNHELRFIVANSLAWSGQYREALRQYGWLADTPHAQAAQVGSANVYLWSGNPHLADPLFRRVLRVEPDNADAREGLASAQRQLRPRSTARGESLDDSTQAERSNVMLAHRWRDADLTQIFEVSGERVDESRSPTGPDLRPRKISFGYQNLSWPLTPKLVLAADSGVRSALFGNLALRTADDAVSVDVGRANWGEVVFDPRARSDGLAAARVGVAARVDTLVGDISASAVHFAVTDGNRVAEANAQYTPAWQPFAAASGVRAFVGVYGRKAQRRDPRYWSPTPGYYIGQIGVSLNQSTATWDFSAELRRSERIGGEGAQGWTAGLSGARWLNRDWAVRVEGLYIETRRDASAYRSKSIAASFDHLW